jgi:hypothetical protein
MWDPQRLTTLWAFTACYRDSFYFYFTYNDIELIDTELSQNINNKELCC